MKYKLLRFSLLSMLAMFSGLWGNGVWAADKWVKTSVDDLKTGDVVVIVDQTSSTAMSNDNGTSAAPVATAVTLSDDKSELTSEAADNLQWVLALNNDNEGGTQYMFSVADTENYLYCTNTNNGVRVGTNSNNTFTLEYSQEYSAYFLKNVATSRFIGVYNNQDWRCYTSVNNNIKNCVTAFYKLTKDESDTRAETSMRLGEYSTTGTAGETMNLPVAYVIKSTGGAIDDLPLTWESTNQEVATIDETAAVINLLAAGTTTIKVSFAGDDTYQPCAASYQLTVSAAAIDEPFTSLKALQEAVTSTSTPVTIKFTDVFVTAVKGNNAYLADAQGYGILVYQKDHGLEAGQVLNGTINANLVLYRGQTEITGFSKDGLTITTTELTPTEKTIADITAANQSTLVTLKGVTFSNGKLSDGTNEITYYDNFGTGSPEEGKTYDITGIVIVYNTTLEIAPRTADDVVEVTAVEQWTWRDFAVQLTDANIFDTSVNNFGVKVAEDGTYTAVAADDATANVTVNSVRFNDSQHGWVNCTFTMKVNGPVLIKLGDCRYGGQNGTITDAENNVTEIKANASKDCWDPNAPDQNVVATYYRGLTPTTLTIKYDGYCPFIGATAIDPADLPAEVTKYTVTFDAANSEAQGVAPEAITEDAGTEITIPANFTLYKEGYTLTGWADETEHAVGSKMTINGDVTLTPVFTANEVSLADRTEPVTVKWNFRRDQGAPAVGWEGKAGLVWVAQATVNGKTIDVALPFSTSPGKFNNKNNTDWVQINNGTTFTIPSCKGATISMEAYNAITTTTIDGQSDYTQGQTISYTVAGAAESVDVVIGDGSYYRYIQVVLPKVEQSQGGGESFDHVAGTINWFVGDEQQPTISNDIAGAISNASVSVGDGLTVDAANYFDTGMVKYTPTTSNSGNVEGVMIEYRVKPAAGVTFQPTQVDYAAVKVGTDNATYSWSYTVDGQESTITKIDPKPDLLRNNGSNSVDNGGTAKLMHTETFEGIGECDEFTFRFYISDCANNKNICIGNVTISGIVNGETVSVNMYQLATVASPAEGGSINVYPVAEQYEEGSEVTLTATENFGYDFVNWTNAAGEEVSNEAKFKYTVTSNETLTANFVAVETYELALTVDGTNDYMVTISPEPTIVDGKMMYEEGTAVQLNANQYEGLVTFTNWNDGDTNSSKIISMTEDVQITAIYAEADIIAGWDFYKRGSEGRKADFAAEDNDGDALILVNTETGETSGWLDKSTEADGGYESFKGAAVNWRTGASNGDVGNWHWQTKINAAAFTDINVQFQMLYNYNAYQTYNAEYSLDGENWTKFGSVTMSSNRVVGTFNEQMPAEANNQAELYIRMIADKTSNVDGAESRNDGNSLAMFFITGTPKLVDDGVAPVLVSTVPADGATGASATGKIVLTFDERVKVADGAKASVAIPMPTGSDEGLKVYQELTPAVSGKVVSFEYKGLEYGAQYDFVLPANSVADLTDNFVQEDICLTFTIMVRPSVNKKLYDFVVPDDGTFKEALMAAAARQDKTSRYRIFVKQGSYVIPANQEAPVEGSDGQSYADPKTYFNTPNVSIIGEDPANTSITNEMPNSLASNPDAGANGQANPLEGIRTSGVLYLQSGATDTYFQDIKLWSATADATGRNVVLVDGGNRTICKNVTLWAYQDTYVSDNTRSLYYFEGGLLRGRTDFLCGSGDVFYNNVTLQMCQDGGYIAVPRDNVKYGYVFKDCTIKGETSKVDGNYYLGRPWTEGAEVYFIDTKMEVVPRAIGWAEMSNGGCTRMAEWNSMTATGSAIDLSGRAKQLGKETPNPNNPVLTAEEALEIGNLHNMFGDWDPTLATEQAPIPSNVKLNSDTKTLTWDNSNYALLWAIVKDGKVVDFTIENTYTVDDADATYAVRAANEMGGLSEAGEALITTSITEVANGEQAMPETIYNLNGIRVDKAQKGLYIINGKKVVVK